MAILDITELFLLISLRRAANRAFDPLGLSTYEAVLLLYVEDGVKQPGELARLLDIQTTAVSALITKLAGMGLVTRTKDKTDSRVVNLDLTPAGRMTVDEVGKAWLAERTLDREKPK